MNETYLPIHTSQRANGCSPRATFTGLGLDKMSGFLSIDSSDNNTVVTSRVLIFTLTDDVPGT